MVEIKIPEKDKCDLCIIDEFLSNEDFEKIKTIFTNENTPWFFSKGIAFPNDTIRETSDTGSLDDYFFSHVLYNNMRPQSDLFDNTINILGPALKQELQFQLSTIIRIKFNLYTRTQIVNRHPWHIDAKDLPKLRGALLMLNTCDGYTGFIDGTKVKSVENRLVLFDSLEKHHSTSTSDASTRMTININYI